MPPPNPFPSGVAVEVQHVKRDGVEVFSFTHHPPLRHAPRPPGRPRSIDPTAEALRLVEVVRFGSFTDEAALGDALGWGLWKVAARRRTALAGGLIAWPEWTKHVAASYRPRSPSCMTVEHTQRVVDLVRSKAFATQTAVGQRLGLSPADITRLKARAIKGGLITGAAWRQRLLEGRNRAAIANGGAQG